MAGPLFRVKMYKVNYKMGGKLNFQSVRSVHNNIIFIGRRYRREVQYTLFSPLDI